MIACLVRKLMVPVVVMVTGAGVAGAQVSDTSRARQRTDSARQTLSPITVTASRTPLPRNKIGAAVSIVTSGHGLEPTPYAARALSRVTGITLDEAAGPGGPTIIRIRGGEEVFGQIIMDGVQINQSGGFFDLQGFTLTNVDRIEVARGPQSALYGSTAVSGVVQFVTRAGQPGRPRFLFESEGSGAAEYGGGFRGSLSAAGGSTRLRYSTGYGVAYDRGIFAVAHDAWTRDGSLRIDHIPSDRFSVTAMARATIVDAHLPVRDAGATRVPLDPNAQNSRDRLVGSVRASHRITPSWSHGLRVSSYNERFTYADLQDGVTHPDFFVFDANFGLNEVLWRTTADYTGLAALPRAGALSMNVAYGAQWEGESLTDRTSGDFGSDTLRLTRTSQAGYGELHVEAGSRVSILLGARAERVEGLSTQFSPRANAVIDVVSGIVAVRAAVGRAFKAPNLQQQFLDNPFIVSNPDLRPETSWSWEVGVETTSPRTSLSAAATFFRQTYNDLIRTVALDGDPNNRQINRNLGRARASGLELEATFEPVPGWRAGIGGSRVETTILDNTGLNPNEYPVGASLPFRPDYTGHVFVQVPVAARLSFLLRSTLMGSQTVLSERFSGARVDIDSYVIAASTVTFSLTDAVSVYGRVENIFNTRYETGFDRRGIPLTAAVGLRAGR